GGVAPDEIDLQLPDPVPWDHDLRERAEPGRESVDDAALVDDPFDERPRRLDPLPRLGREDDLRRGRRRDRLDLLEPETVAVEFQHGSHARQDRPRTAASQAGTRALAALVVPELEL